MADKEKLLEEVNVHDTVLVRIYQNRVNLHVMTKFWYFKLLIVQHRLHIQLR